MEKLKNTLVPCNPHIPPVGVDSDTRPDIAVTPEIWQLYQWGAPWERQGMLVQFRHGRILNLPGIPAVYKKYIMAGWGDGVDLVLIWAAIMKLTKPEIKLLKKCLEHQSLNSRMPAQIGKSKTVAKLEEKFLIVPVQAEWGGPPFVVTIKGHMLTQLGLSTYCQWESENYQEDECHE